MYTYSGYLLSLFSFCVYLNIQSVLDIHIYTSGYIHIWIYIQVCVYLLSLFCVYMNIQSVLDIHIYTSGYISTNIQSVYMNINKYPESMYMNINKYPESMCMNINKYPECVYMNIQSVLDIHIYTSGYISTNIQSVYMNINKYPEYEYI